MEDLETEVGKEHDKVIWHFLYILKSKSGVEITSYIIAPFTGLKYRSVTDIVRPIHQIVRRTEETT